MSRRVVTLAALLTVLVVACGGDDESNATATFTGIDCQYNGPAEFALNSTVTFTVTNASETTSIGFAVLKFPEGSTAEDVFSEGLFNVIDGDARLEPYVASPTNIGTEYEMTVRFDEAGQHGINCFDFAGGGAPGSDFVTMFTVLD